MRFDLIKISRTRNDATGNPIRPNDNWFKKAKAKSKKAIEEGKDHKVDRDLYAHVEVKMALEELFQFKCAYCETSINRIEWDVEHFRPKGRVEERRDHPGYFWLPYEWDNLFPSCQLCNQFRKAKPRWLSEEPQFPGGKADHFPVEPESTRAMKPEDDIDKEKRILVDPCADEPEKMFKYDHDGQIFPLTNMNKKKAEASIMIFNLRETRLRDDRKSKIKSLIGLLKLAEDLGNNGNEIPARRVIEIAKQMYLGDDSEYAGICRYVFNNPNSFGIDL